MTFTYCGKAPEDFGCYYIPDEDQISDMMSEYEQFAGDFEARDGGYYFGDRQPPKEFDLPCYYEDIDKKTMEQIVRWLDRRTSGRLVFDERPDVYYDVVPSAKIEFEDYSYTKYGKTLHAGEFTIHFTAYDPFGKLTKKFLRTGEEMDYSTNLIPETQMPPAPSVTDTSFLVYNPGTERTGLILRVAGDAPNGQVIKNTTNGQEIALLPFNQAVTTTAGKWFEIDSKKGQVYLVGAATRELAFEYHDKGYIALEANLGFEDGKTISFSQGGNTVTATDDENGFSADDIGKYIYTGDGWHKILSVSDATIVGCGKNLLPLQTTQTKFGVTIAVQADGGVHISGTCTAASGPVTFEYPVNMTLDGEFTLSMGNSQAVADHLQIRLTDGPGATLYDANGTSSNITAQNANSAVTLELIHQHVDGWIIRVGGGETYDVTLYPRLERGNTATAFEPYEDVPFISIDNAQGQVQSVAVEAGCRAKQAGAGDPSPSNIRAISGRESVEIVACGKNIWKFDSIVTVSNGHQVFTFIPELPAGTYMFSCSNLTIDGNSSDAYLQGQDALGNKTSIPNPYIYPGNNASVEVTLVRTTSRIVLYSGHDYNTSQSNVTTFANIQLELGSTATAYEPYTPMGGSTVTPSEPLYGLPGAEDTVDVSVDGDVLVTRRTKKTVFDGTENWAVQETGTGSGTYRMVYTQSTFDGVLPASNGDVINAICSHYSVRTPNSTYLKNVGISISTFKQWQVWDDNYNSSDAGLYKAYLAAQYAAGTPVTIVYELATPTTETPADVDPIEPQAGEVNVFTDTDSLNITLYKTDNNKYASVTGSFSQTQNDFASMLTQMNEISISGEDVELTKLEIDYVPQVR